MILALPFTMEDVKVPRVTPVLVLTWASKVLSPVVPRMPMVATGVTILKFPPPEDTRPETNESEPWTRLTITEFCEAAPGL